MPKPENNQTPDIIHEGRDYTAIVNEYKELYGSLEQQIELFSQSQPHFIKELSEKVAEELPDYKGKKADIIAQAYGILVTDDIFKSKYYSIGDFASDIDTLLSFMNNKEITDKEYLSAIIGFRNAITTSSKVIYNIGRSIIIFKGNDIADEVIEGLITRRAFLPAFEELMSIYEVAGIKPDFRWIINHFSMSYEQLLLAKRLASKTKSYRELFDKVKVDYPLGKGKAIIWDLILSTVVSNYYRKHIDLLQPEIDELHKRLLDEREQSKRSYERSKFVAEQQGKTEQIRAAIDSILLETLHLGWELTPLKEQRMKKNAEIIIKRMAIEEYGVQDLKDPQEYFKYLEDSFFEAFYEYPQLLIPIIDPKDYRKFVHDPKGFLKEYEKKVKQQINYHLKKKIPGTKFTPTTVAHGFCDLLISLLKDPRIKRFDLR